MSTAREEVQKWLEAGRPISAAELSRTTGIPKTTIFRNIKALTPKDHDETETLLEKVRTGAISDEAANRILGKIMADGKDTDRIKAIDVYDTRNRASTARIGPPPPQSPQQIIDRLSLIFQAAEPQHLIEAAQRHGYQMVTSPPASQTPDDPPVTGPPDQADLAPPEQ